MTCLSGPRGAHWTAYRGAGKLVVAEIDLGDFAFNKVLVDSAGHYARPEVLMTIDARPKTGLTVLAELEAETA